MKIVELFEPQFAVQNAIRMHMVDLERDLKREFDWFKAIKRLSGVFWSLKFKRI